MRTRLALVVIAATAAAACGQTAPSGGSLPAGSGSGSVAPVSPTASGLPASPGYSPIAARPTGQIAFLRPEASTGEGRVNIYLVDAVGDASPVRLTNDDRLEQVIFWQLDGSRLIYAWSTWADPYHQTLTSIRADGTDSRDLGPVQTAYADPPLSPDGRFVVFGGDGTEAGTSGLVLLDLRDGRRIQLTTDGAMEPVWSPDGTRVLAIMPSRGLEIVDPESATVVATIRDPNVERLVGWTADGQSILFHSCGPELTKPECMAAPTLIANADGTNIRTYTGVVPSPADPAMPSPDGRWVVTATSAGQLTVASVNGGPEVLIGVGTGPRWSPDSDWIVFSAAATGPAASAAGPSIGLVVVHRLGGAVVRLTDGPYDQAAAWQP